MDQDEDAEMGMSLGAPLLNQKWVVNKMFDVYGTVQLVNPMLNCLVLITLFVSCRLMAEVRTIHCRRVVIFLERNTVGEAPNVVILIQT